MKTKQIEELKPCPFCGCYGEKRFNKYYFFHKKKCVFSDLSNYEEAVTGIIVTDIFGIEKWNTRYLDKSELKSQGYVKRDSLAIDEGKLKYKLNHTRVNGGFITSKRAYEIAIKLSNISDVIKEVGE